MAMPRAFAEAQRLLRLDKSRLEDFVETLKKVADVYGPVRKGVQYSFQLLEDTRLELDYHTTILPPKKLLHEPFEKLFSFEEDRIEVVQSIPDRPQVILGIHPCDVHAIEILDQVYGGEYEDPYYQRKREQTLLIALNCTTVHESCFCSSLGTGPELKSGYDVLLTDLGDQFLVEVGTPRGAELIAEAGLEPAPRVTLVDKERRLNEARNHLKKRLLTQDLDQLLKDNFRHPVWEELRHECLACGSCTMVCPTCFCYNTVDVLNLDLKSGWRERVWDSCLLLDYAQVAQGMNFRKDRDARIKHRVYHKLVYYEPQFGTLGCVGCGRCIDACIKGIDITEIIRELRGE